MNKILKNLFLPVIGLASLLWFLIRVIPKPSRSTYPCMRATAPIASSFVIYVLGLFSSLVIFKKARKYFVESRYILFSVALLIGFSLVIGTHMQTDEKVYADFNSVLEDPNQSMGMGKGVNPGRVAWIHDPDATDETLTNRTDDYWSQDDNTDQDVVNAMLSDGLKLLTGETSGAAAWDAIFRYHNQIRGKGDVGYSAGEKIVIKINLNTGVSGSNYTRSKWTLGNLDTSPHIVFAILDQLVNQAGAAQADISVGDPGRNVDDLYWDKCQPVFPDVHYWGNGNGRTPIVKSDNTVWFASDGGKDDYLPQCYLDAEYMINIPVFKKHHRAGISFTSKNHFGTFVPFNSNGANDFHYSLPCSQGAGFVDNGDYSLYRCFVDIMGHEHIGGKTILYLIDGIWSSTDWGDPPIKWAMTPFNDDYPSSLFLSQDPVAIESVGFDFFYEEFDTDHPTEGGKAYPHYEGVDDFLHQSADSSNWPEDFIYDPEDDGTPVPSSMGVHEHWNNAVDKQYSRNMGGDEGIELVYQYQTSTEILENSNGSGMVSHFTLYQNHPNPFNLFTSIRYHLINASQVHIAIYNATGQKVRTLVNGYQSMGSHLKTWDGLTDSGFPVPSGIYIYRIMASSNDRSFTQIKKMVLSK